MLSIFDGLMATQRISLPYAYFSINSMLNFSMLYELSLGGIVGMGLMDADAWGLNYALPVPSNDKSIWCIYFFLSLVIRLSLNGKIYALFSFFLAVRPFSRKRWVQTKLLNLGLLDLNRFFNNTVLYKITPFLLNFYKMSQGLMLARNDSFRYNHSYLFSGVSFLNYIKF